MISYHKVSLADKEWMTSCLKVSDFQGSEYCFVNQFLWGNLSHMQVAQVEGALCTIYQKDKKNAVHDFPAGGNQEAAIKALLEDDKELGRNTVFRGILETEKIWMEKQFPDFFQYEEDRDAWDYVYPVETLKNLAGRKLHGKRNHIARFKENENWSYEPMSVKNIRACRDMYLEWLESNRNRLHSSIEREKAIVNGCFMYFEELDLQGGVLRQNDEVVGFCIGEPLNSDTFIVHIEKAYTEIQGAYPMINQQFVIHSMEEFQYVNREDDMGQEGLRRAKMSYQPDPLLQKYIARLSEEI